MTCAALRPSGHAFVSARDHHPSAIIMRFRRGAGSRIVTARTGSVTAGERPSPQSVDFNTPRPTPRPALTYRRPQGILLLPPVSTVKLYLPPCEGGA